MKLEIEDFKEPSDIESDESQGEQTKETLKETPTPSQNETELQGQKCEVQEHEARYNLKGERNMKVVNSKEDDEKDDAVEYAIRSWKYFSREGTVEEQSYEICSPQIVQALQTVIGEYPSVSFLGDTVLIVGKLKCIFHYREELMQYRDKLDNAISKIHVTLCLRLMERELRGSIRHYKSLVEGVSSDKSIDFKNLWMVFRPKDLIVAGKGDTLSVLEYSDMRYFCDPSKWVVTGKNAVYDGSSLGYGFRDFDVRSFEGSRQLKKLAVRPLKYEADRDKILETVKKRGKVFCSLIGSHYRSYNGIAVALAKEPEWDRDRWVLEYPTETTMVQGRIMIDSRMFGVIKAANRVIVKERIPERGCDEGDSSNISEITLAICHYLVPGFSFLEKKWCFFKVDHIKEIVFNEKAFDMLLLPGSQKRIIHALVKNHARDDDDDFDDMIQGKGKGLVFLLHGLPGIGKTFTAESIADYLKKPFYVISSGELGITQESVEANLNNVLKIATAWKALVLIDEADVFLEQRMGKDLARDGLVSLFLRTLEYYQGILFLTTNRLTTFDLAFKSRIHLAIKYESFDAEARKQLWKLFISRTPQIDMSKWTDAILDRLAAVSINGRQIKNAVGIASSLARAEGSKLLEHHFDVVIDQLQEFENDFNQDAPVETNKVLAQ